MPVSSNEPKISREGSFSPMADYLYMVDLSANEETASNPKYVDRLLVQLMCDEHKRISLPGGDREASACELAVSRYDPENTLFGYRRGKRQHRAFPSLLRAASIHALFCKTV